MKTLETAGIISEYNPLHGGHLLHLRLTKEALGPDAVVICAMSGNFVQRADFALVRKHARAEAAVRSGADLVLELPLPWAVSSAERFAEGGVRVLAATGLVTALSFGSECGDAAALSAAAACLDSGEYRVELRRLLDGGRTSYAACRQAAVERLLGRAQAALLSAPNNNLGVEYLRALRRLGSSIVPLTFRREGAAHDGPEAGGIPSASSLRGLLERDCRDAALAGMAPAMRTVFLREEAAGRAPVSASRCERAVLARLRTMDRAEFAALDEGNEGFSNRLYAASRTAPTLEELLTAAKTKRCAYARLRRMALWAYLGLTPAEVPAELPYLRVLAANAAGRALLARMRKTASVPVLTKPADVRRLSGAARRLFALEARASDLYALAFPSLSSARGGMEWREDPVIL